ncbi:MAG: hypothetical protein RR254_09200, partial [Muribaculaceae bacterium]
HNVVSSCERNCGIRTLYGDGDFYVEDVAHHCHVLYQIPVGGVERLRRSRLRGYSVPYNYVH